MLKKEKRNFGFPQKQIIPPVKYSNMVAFFSKKVISFSLEENFLVAENLLSCKTHFEYEACLDCG
ncbi:hypothetical protein [Mucilaginibacter sp.]|uniref:hypothetical protein n=1 Tax=Mucilaginibacter sp. TaxID=1882438 RepID=UPI002601DFE7|nr:hypothetical protein [Mucilaginibacter sp.]